MSRYIEQEYIGKIVSNLPTEVFQTENRIELVLSATEAINAIKDAPTIKTKQVKYYDEDESVWKIGEVIVNSSEKPNNCTEPQKPSDDDETIQAIAHLQKVGWLQAHDKALTEPQTYITEDRDTQILDAWQVKQMQRERSE